MRSNSEICQQCGKPIDSSDDPQLCPRCICPGCDGLGYVEFGHYSTSGPWTETCKLCHGTKKADLDDDEYKKDCDAFNRTGRSLSH